MTHAELVVVGGGPAGLAVARRVGEARPGWRIVLVDENVMLGGQITRQRLGNADRFRGALPRNVEVRTRTLAVGWTPEHALVLAGPTGRAELAAETVVVATGAREVVHPLPGWTLPGVMTTGAAQALLKGSGSFPFRTVVVGGRGPLMLAAAAQMAAAGVRVVGLLGGVAPRPALGDVPALLGGGRTLVQGAGYLATLARHRVRMRPRARVVAVLGEGRVAGVRAAVPGRRDLEFACDAVLLGDGFASTYELAAQRGVRVLPGGDVPLRDAWGRTSVPDLFVIGDGAGVQGSAVAELEGELAAVAIAGGAVPGVDVSRVRARLRRLRRFQEALGRMEPPPAPDPSADTVVCRCTGATVGDVAGAIELGVTTMAGLKLWTRAGMGPCQGRTCDQLLRRVVERSGGEAPCAMTAQFPARPVSMGDLVRGPRSGEDACT